MRQQRLKLSEVLHQICPHVYFQPPNGTKMDYPAIRYERSKPNVKYANNQLYFQKQAYVVTVIDKDPDSEIAERVSKLPMCTFDRPYPANGLNHFVYTLFF